MSKSIVWAPAPSTGPRPAARRWLARALRRAGRVLDRLARHLTRADRPPPVPPVLEFYAEAGAPEGALYVDGLRVGILHGVTRL